MRNRPHLAALAAAVVLAFSGAWGARAGGLSEQAVKELTALYPGAQVGLDGGRVRVVYGAPMTPGATAQLAADAFLAEHAGVFGIEGLTLEPAWTADIRDGKFTVFAYRQTVSGLPVEGTVGRVLVLNTPLPQVVYAAGLFAPLPEGGFPTELIDTEKALARVKGLPLYANLPVWSQPELAMWQSYERKTPVTLAWKFVGQNPDLANHSAYTFFVDAASGRLLEARSEVYNTDVSGKVETRATPGTLPDIAANPPVLMPVGRIRVSIDGGGEALTELDGTYKIPNAGVAQVTVGTRFGEAVGDGQWVHVDDVSGTAQGLTMPALPPGPADFILNDVPSATVTAQANAFVHTTLTHNYFKDRAATFTKLDESLRANVNLSATCNAFFTTQNGPSINFYLAGGGCVNTSYSSVVAHEYGHYIVYRLDLEQGAFGEGYSDTVAMLLYDDWVVGRNFFNNGGFIRDPNNANKQYPCMGEAHDCGQLLAGVWWDIRKNLAAKYGDPTGLNETRQLQVDWSLITTGGQGSNSAHPTTAIEALTVDDNDGNVLNGTPNFNAICAAFAKHNIACPELKLIKFTYPAGLPTLLTPDTETTVEVLIEPDLGAPTPGSGKIVYSVGGGPPVEAAMTETSPNHYLGKLPATACTSSVVFYFKAAAVGGLEIVDPPTAPEVGYKARSALAVVEAFVDDFETDKGWSYGVPGDTAPKGIWNRMDPQQTTAPKGVVQPQDDHTLGAGTMCAVTDGKAGIAAGDFDVDGGFTTLMSPEIDLAAGGLARVSYWRWFTNDKGGIADDAFVVELSADGGTTWHAVETVGPAGPQAAGGWFYYEFDPAAIVPLSSTMRLRFRAADLNAGTLLEALVDDVEVLRFTCEACVGDIDGDGVTGQGDLGLMLQAYGKCEGEPGYLAAANLSQATTCPSNPAQQVIDQADLGVLLEDYGCGK